MEIFCSWVAYRCCQDRPYSYPCIVLATISFLVYWPWCHLLYLCQVSTFYYMLKMWCSYHQGAIGRKVYLELEEKNLATSGNRAKSCLFPRVAMKFIACPYCGAQMKRNEKTKTGAQRWRCERCGGARTYRINNDTKQLDIFFDWLFSSEKQMDMSGQRLTFRRMSLKFWKL